MPDIADILDDEIADKKTPHKFLFLSLRAWERICLAIMMLIGGLVLERASTITNRLDAIESKMGSDQKQWERINEISRDVNDNKVSITHTSGHHAVIDRDIDSMWLALKSVDNEAAKIAIQSGVNKELLRLIIEENILSSECDKCIKEEMAEEIEKPAARPPKPPKPNVEHLNELNQRIEQIPEEIDDYRMRQMKR
jgi:hypothetical protein